ncbi:hypothetical protein [Agrococcus sp. DT81.2]|uniref:hypothetical protein n=1 Tax=Agrococcus sp. DT81.2 TaxID=3393414 RepID=UPI003CE5C4A2
MLKSSVIGLAVALVLVGCAPAEVSGPASSAPEPQAATVTPAPTPSAEEAAGCPNPHGGACLGALEAGEHQTRVFQPAITYTVPAGWTNYEDLPGNFWLFQTDDLASQDSAVGGSYLGIYQDAAAAALDCAEAPEQGVNRTPEALVAWYQSVPTLTVTPPVPVTVGGLEGLQIDLVLVDGAEADMCSYGPYAGVPLIIGSGVSQLHHVLLDALEVRLVLLRRGEGNVTLEITNVEEQHSSEEFRASLQPILDSLVFAG